MGIRVVVAAVGAVMVASLAPITGTYAQVAASTAPSVKGVSPGHGSAAGGTKVTIKGRNLSNAAKVTFDGVKGTHLHVVSAKKLTVVTPAHADGTVDVRVKVGRHWSSKVKADHYRFVTLTWKTVAAGQEFTCGTRTNDRLYCWGYGSQGELGLGDYDDRFEYDDDFAVDRS